MIRESSELLETSTRVTAHVSKSQSRIFVIIGNDRDVESALSIDTELDWFNDDQPVNPALGR